MRQCNRSYRHVQYLEKDSTYRDMIQCVLNCTATCARKWGEILSQTVVWPCREIGKQVLKVRVPYCGTESANRQKYRNNRPGITMRDNKQGTCMSIDVAIPADRNVIKEEAGNISKYGFLKIEIEPICNVTVKAIPVIMG